MGQSGPARTSLMQGPPSTGTQESKTLATSRRKPSGQDLTVVSIITRLLASIGQCGPDLEPKWNKQRGSRGLEWSEPDTGRGPSTYSQRDDSHRCFLLVVAIRRLPVRGSAWGILS